MDTGHYLLGPPLRWVFEKESLLMYSSRVVLPVVSTSYLSD